MGKKDSSYLLIDSMVRSKITQRIISISEWTDDISVQLQALSNGTLVEIPVKQHTNNIHIL